MILCGGKGIGVIMGECRIFRFTCVGDYRIGISRCQLIFIVSSLVRYALYKEWMSNESRK